MTQQLYHFPSSISISLRELVTSPFYVVWTGFLASSYTSQNNSSDFSQILSHSGVRHPPNLGQQNTLSPDFKCWARNKDRRRVIIHSCQWAPTILTVLAVWHSGINQIMHFQADFFCLPTISVLSLLLNVFPISSFWFKLPVSFHYLKLKNSGAPRWLSC